MKSFRILGSLAILGSMLLVGCGGKSSKDETLNLERFISQGSDTTCEALVQCSCTDASGLADCKTAYRAMLGVQLGSMQAAYPGRKLDPTAAQKCLDDVKAELSDCNAPLMETLVAPAVVAGGGPSMGFIAASCDMDEVFPGMQAEGDPCGSSGDCAAGLSCDQRDDTCAPSAALGESCQTWDTGNLDCADGLFCYTGGTSNVCEKQPAAGEACPHYNCVDGISCVTVDTVLTCVAPHALDADCSDGAGCVEGTYCDTTSMTPTCVARLADGADCTSSSQCVNDWCNGLDKCDSYGICGIFGPG